MYTKLLAIVGVGFGLSETEHTYLLFVAVTVSLGVSGYRSVRTRRAWPFGVALCGSLLVLAGHLGDELHELEWAGMVVLLVGGVGEQLRLRARPTPRVVQAAS